MQIKILLLLLILGVTFGCNNDIDVNAPAKEIYIVYGVLDPEKPRQEIRLQRAFLTESNAIEYAGNTDLSIPDATVTLTSELGETFTLTAVDTTRDNGTFKEQITVYVSQLGDTIRPGRRYTLRATLPGGDAPIVEAATSVPMRPRITQPDSLVLIEGLTDAYPIAPFNNQRFEIRYVPRPLFTEQLAVGAAYELRIFFRYAENGTPQPELRFGPGSPQLIGAQGVGRFIIGQGFQVFLQGLLDGRQNLTFDDSYLAESCELEVTAMDEELYNYIRVNSPIFVDFNTIRPEYTNVTGGFGIFGSINKTHRYVRLPQCTQYLAGLNNTPPPTGDCPAE